jgi:D-alanyl-D-alanine carboxypeptidase
MISTLADMRVWAEAVATGTLLSPASHALQIGMQSVGLGPLTAERYYGLGIAIVDDWVFSNPHVPGYGGLMTYFPPEKITLIVMTTPGPGNLDDQNYGQDAFVRIAEVLTPARVPDIGQRTH